MRTLEVQRERRHDRRAAPHEEPVQASEQRSRQEIHAHHEIEARVRAWLVHQIDLARLDPKAPGSGAFAEDLEGDRAHVPRFHSVTALGEKERMAADSRR
ncbi:hypothetical protein D3C83_67860 [compost metagenome]